MLFDLWYEQLFYSIGQFVSNYIGIGVIVFFGVVGIILWKDPLMHLEHPNNVTDNLMRSCGNKPEHDFDESLYPNTYMVEKPDCASDEWFNAHMAKSTSAPQNKITYKPQTKISEKDRVLLNEIERKKNNLIIKKNIFISGASEEAYQSALQDFDTRTKIIQDRIYLESKVYSILNPTIEVGTTTALRPPRLVVPEIEYKKYIHSPLWRKRSRDFRESKNGICDICHECVGIANLQTHHISYTEDLISDDNPSFWEASCRECHKKQEQAKQPPTKKEFLKNGKYAPTTKEASRR